ncbi:hypothetical protein FHS82_001053 [Pseudochelatococcus lubricantis]|uniref:HK97 gp10 family phage protein n=1 Tax=Pseudochelatococcus lubricantis TaxID=1538102 RepID=A0ABX0UW85_9HYPH|nr:HK97 gp10 family phage protein [Pseudochelatococcus lubricantis]NIJ57227.1 hypothetical protein [Pseudochelatococcus lubricantis]
MAKSTSGKKWALDISKWAKQTRVDLDTIVRKVSLDMFTRIILKSPVDTGRFRGNWQVSIGSVANGTIAVDDKDGSATISAAQAATMGVKAGDTIYLTNNLPYAERLEDGWSKQAPAGMVATTVREFAGVVDKAASEVFKD